MFKFGIVGAGIIGRSHADILKKNPDCTLVAVCDTVVERAEEIAKEHNAASFTDYKEMAEKAELDAVILNLPHFLHEEASVFFLERNINVLLEKPMAMTTAECDRIIEAEKNSSAKLAVGHLQRYYDAYTKVKDIIADGSYGKLCMITEVRNVNYLPNRPKWFLDKKLSGGGIVMNYGAHTLDKIMYVTDAHVTEASGYLTNPLSDDNVEINAQLLMKLDSGVSVGITYCGCPGVNDYETIFYFEQGVAKIRGGEILYLSENGKFLEPTNENNNALERQTEDFVKLLKGEKSGVVTSSYGREVIRVLESVFNEEK